ncbi:tetratricopeptide repeat protein [Anaerolineales bacterium HSG24]|nr:tetratricopeptide repeat protein [Anaerolineales bacterium HSG24]
MAKRKQKTRQQNITQQAERLTKSAAQAFNGGDIHGFHSHLITLRRILANQPDRLKQAETEIALAITDEGTPLEDRVAAFEGVVGVHPRHPYALVQTALALVESNQYQAALKKCKQALKIAPKDEYNLTAYHLALVAYAGHLGEYKQAIDIYEKALQIDPTNCEALMLCGAVFMEIGEFETAIEKFKQAEKLGFKDPMFLTVYGKALVEINDYESAIEKLELSIHADPDNLENIEYFGSVLAQYCMGLIIVGIKTIPFDKFERALEIAPDNVVLLLAYGIVLAHTGKTATIEIFEKALTLKPNDSNILRQYGVALTYIDNHEGALKKFTSLLDINPNDVQTIYVYAHTLIKLKQEDKAITTFQQALQRNPSNQELLNGYALILGLLNRFEDAVNQYEEVIEKYPNNFYALHFCGFMRLYFKNFDDAITCFERALNIKPNNRATLSLYGIALMHKGQYEKAVQQFEKLLYIRPNSSLLPTFSKNFDLSSLLEYNPDLNANTFFSYIDGLEKVGRYNDAMLNLQVLGNQIQDYKQNDAIILFICLTLGRLHYLNKDKQQGNHYFNLAIENSDNDDAIRLNAAKNILSIEPYSEEGVAILEEVIETSPHYEETRRWLALHTAGKKYFQLFNPPNPTATPSTDEVTISDTNMLNRTIYHNIANEVALLKEIVYDLNSDMPDNAITNEIMTNINQILAGIKQRREAEKTKVQVIPAHDYDRIMATIAETAHDISDFVNNELAIIEEDVRVALETVAKTDTLKVSKTFRVLNATYQANLADLLKQIKFTQAALNDLKTINEGLKLTYQRFSVPVLFEKWLDTPTIANASITVEVKNQDSIFDGDPEKLKSFLNELVENSLKHNPDKPDLQIHMTAEDIDLPKGKQLRLTYQDNGQGIPSKNKRWVFLPLKTTSAEGSGLGLFSIKRTLNAMHGTIEETGTNGNGAQFEITLPYLNGDAP